MVHRVDDRAGPEEQQRLEEGVGEEVEDGGRVGADAEGHEHVAELRAGRVGDHALDVVLDEADRGREERRDAADDRDHDEGVGGELEQRRQARHHEHAGRHHGGGVDQRRDRGRALHRVRQPGVQQELRRLAHGAHEQQQAGERQGAPVVAEEVEGGVLDLGRTGEDAVEGDRAGQHEDEEDAEREAEIADAVDDEGLHGGGVGRGLLVPEPDQQVGGEADALPAEEHLHEVVGRHQHQHGEGEERQVGEEARPVRILLHVADGVEVHEGRDRGHDDQHHHRQRVDAEGPVDHEVAGGEPGRDLHAGGVLGARRPRGRRPRTAAPRRRGRPVVTPSLSSAPSWRPNRPAIRAPTSGRKTIA